MAKKGQVQLQTEVTNEDEWEKLLQKEGLIRKLISNSRETYRLL